MIKVEQLIDYKLVTLLNRISERIKKKTKVFLSRNSLF